VLDGHIKTIFLLRQDLTTFMVIHAIAGL